MSAMHQATSPDLEVVASNLKDILEVYFNLCENSPNVIVDHQNLDILHFFLCFCP